MTFSLMVVVLRRTAPGVADQVIESPRLSVRGEPAFSMSRSIRPRRSSTWPTCAPMQNVTDNVTLRRRARIVRSR